MKECSTEYSRSNALPYRSTIPLPICTACDAESTLVYMKKIITKIVVFLLLWFGQIHQKAILLSLDALTVRNTISFASFKQAMGTGLMQLNSCFLLRDSMLACTCYSDRVLIASIFSLLAPSAADYGAGYFSSVICDRFGQSLVGTRNSVLLGLVLLNEAEAIKIFFFSFPHLIRQAKITKLYCVIDKHPVALSGIDNFSSKHNAKYPSYGPGTSA
jgi:hypothetical protein